jgi:hypothetical protein
VAATIEVIKFRDVLKVDAIPRFVPGLQRTVELKGQDFRTAESVFINEAPAKEFVIVNRSTIYAQLPDGVDGIRTVSVLSSDFTKTSVGSRIEFKLGSKTKKIEGILKLVQLFTKILLQSPGSDIQDPEIGGGLQDMVGFVSSTYRTEPILAALAKAVALTGEQIRRSQLGLSGLPLSERLLSASVLDLHIDRGTDEARCRFQIDSVAGQSAVTALDL